MFKAQLWNLGARCCKNYPNKRLKMDCQRVAFPVPLSRSGYGCCV
ncbi:transcriptional regulator [Vibrio cholerae]|nr:transcriptional regulator [Vibrio cholerae]TYW48381.1 transcriptional regulator [Vibrio cholerae]